VKISFGLRAIMEPNEMELSHRSGSEASFQLGIH
jgi:hypothetical protein